MLKDRAQMGYAHNPAMGLVMTMGGYYKNASEATHDGADFYELPAPQMQGYGSCLASVSDDTVVTTGGYRLVF